MEAPPQPASSRRRRPGAAPSPINVRASRSLSGMVYDRKLESSFDPATGSYSHRLAHSRVSPRSKARASPRPFFLNADLADRNRNGGRGRYASLGVVGVNGSSSSPSLPISSSSSSYASSSSIAINARHGKHRKRSRRRSSKLVDAHVELRRTMASEAKSIKPPMGGKGDGDPFARDGVSGMPSSSAQSRIEPSPALQSQAPPSHDDGDGSVTTDPKSETSTMTSTAASLPQNSESEFWDSSSSSSSPSGSDSETELMPPHFEKPHHNPTWKERFALSAVQFCEGQRSWIFLMMLGVLSSVLAWMIDEVSDLLLQSRGQLATIIRNHKSGGVDEGADGGGWWLSYLFYIVWAALMAPIASAITMEIHSQASGSGIPQLKSLMSGYRMRGFLGMRMLLAKALGVILALGSGLLIGKEGPFVCIAASIAALLMRHVNLFRHMETNVQLHRDALSAACAVGVAATFGAPIGGVLFAIEVTSSFFQVSGYWKGFFAAVSGAVVFKQLQASNIGRARLENLTALFSTQFESLPYRSAELPLFILLGVVAGAFAAAFLRLQAFFVRSRRNWMTRKAAAASSSSGAAYTCNILRSPVVTVAIVAALTAVVTYPLGDYMTFGLRRTIDDLFHEGGMGEKASTYADDWVSWRGSGSEKSDVSAGPESGAPQYGLAESSLLVHLSLFIAIKFVLAAATQTLPIPFGVIVPVFGIGAAMGRLVGELLYAGGATMVTPGGYAVVGAAAFTAGVTHTVSVAVIVFELTSQLSYMLPVLLAVLIGRMVSSRMSSAGEYSGGIFSQIGQQLNLNQDPVLGNDSSYVLTVEHVIRSKLENRRRRLHQERRRRRRKRRRAKMTAMTTKEGESGTTCGDAGDACDKRVMPPTVPRYVSQGRLKDLLAADSAQHSEANQEWGVVEDLRSMIFLGTVSRRELMDIATCDALFASGSGTSDDAAGSKRFDGTSEDEVFSDQPDGDLRFVPIVKRKRANSTGSNPSSGRDMEIDLVASELLDLDYSCCIKSTESLSECILKFATTHAQMLFLLRRGKLVGSLTLGDVNGY